MTAAEPWKCPYCKFTHPTSSMVLMHITKEHR